jgi:hypothetical protein
MEEVAARPRGQCRTKPPSSGAAETRPDARSSGIRHLTPPAPLAAARWGVLLCVRCRGLDRRSCSGAGARAGWSISRPPGPSLGDGLGRKQSMWLSRTTRGVRTTHLCQCVFPGKQGDGPRATEVEPKPRKATGQGASVSPRDRCAALRGRRLSAGTEGSLKVCGAN